MNKIYFDGSTSLNSICWYDETERCWKLDKMKVVMTNNQLEYSALIVALSYVHDRYSGCEEVIFCGDSELVIKQMTEEYEVKSTNLKALNAIAVQLTNNEYVKRDLKDMFKWVSRTKNLAGLKLDDAISEKHARV